MKAKASVIAQKLLNLYRQAHVIAGGWVAVNKIFLDESTDEVITELQDLPTGKFLIQHIKNLRDGKTSMDSIARELLPYGGMLAESVTEVDIEPDDFHDLIMAIDEFTPSHEGLDKFMNNPFVRNIGADWIMYIKNMLAKNPAESKKFDGIVQTWKAYQAWDMANDAISRPVDDRLRAQIQLDMPEYETYLPRFGEQGNEILRRLRELTSSLPKSNNRA